MKYLDPEYCWRMLRAHQWWHYKLPLALSVIFSISCANHISAAHATTSCLFLILCGLISGFFASLINDITDLEQDKKASKTTPVMKLSNHQRMALLLFSTILVLSASVLLLPLGLPALYFALLICAFVAYSVKPLRLKERGIAGLLCISLGEHLLPALLAISLVTSISGSQPSTLWLASVCIWAAFFGLRGILWHQLSDLEADKISGCKTFGVSIGARGLRLIGEYIVFPVELLAFLTFAYLSTSLAFWLFIPYIIADLLEKKLYGVNFRIVAPAENHRFILFDFYRFYFPLACLIASSLHEPSFWPMVIGFVLLFGTPVLKVYWSIPGSIRWQFFEKMKLSRSKKAKELTVSQFEDLR